MFVTYMGGAVNSLTITGQLLIDHPDTPEKPLGL